MTSNSLHSLPNNSNQADLTDCDDINCPICQDQDSTLKTTPGAPDGKTQAAVYGKMMDAQFERKMEAHSEIQRIAQVLRNMHIGR